MGITLDYYRNVAIYIDDYWFIAARNLNIFLLHFIVVVGIISQIEQTEIQLLTK